VRDNLLIVGRRAAMLGVGPRQAELRASWVRTPRTQARPRGPRLPLRALQRWTGWNRGSGGRVGGQNLGRGSGRGSNLYSLGPRPLPLGLILKVPGS